MADGKCGQGRGRRQAGRRPRRRPWSCRGGKGVLAVAVDARLSEEQVRAWVARSCAAQGVPVQVSDALVIELVRVLLTGTAGPTKRTARPSSTAGLSAVGALTPASEPPDRLHPVGVQAAGAEGAGADDGVVEHGPDDRGLPGQVQSVPRSA